MKKRRTNVHKKRKKRTTYIVWVKTLENSLGMEKREKTEDVCMCVDFVCTQFKYSEFNANV